jgi:protein tyrosine phosphatase (PTP) superfamily phosphohydrolase (DUF442 family)
MPATAALRPAFRAFGAIPGRLRPSVVALGFVVFVAGTQTGALASSRDALLWVRDYALHANFHEVVPGELFRSAEMSHEHLAATIRDYAIATVVDLRNGEPDPDESGRTEKDIVAAAGAAYVHVPLLSSKVPSRARLLELLDVFERSEKPILVHCSSGALRTGVASAIWLLTEEGAPPFEAVDQLDVRYGYTWIETALRRWQHGFDPLATILDTYTVANRTEAIAFRAWVEAGSDGYNAAGIRQFFPRGEHPDAS